MLQWQQSRQHHCLRGVRVKRLFYAQALSLVPGGTALLFKVVQEPAAADSRALTTHAESEAQSQTHRVGVCVLNQAPHVVHENIQTWEAEAWVLSASRPTLLGRKVLPLLCRLLAFDFFSKMDNQGTERDTRG